MLQNIYISNKCGSFECMFITECWKKKYNSFYENTEQQNCCLHLKQCLYSFLRSNKHLGCISFPTDCMKLILYIIYWIIYFWQYYCAALVENNNRPYWLILWTLLMYFVDLIDVFYVHWKTFFIETSSCVKLVWISRLAYFKEGAHSPSAVWSSLYQLVYVCFVENVSVKISGLLCSYFLCSASAWILSSSTAWAFRFESHQLQFCSSFPLTLLVRYSYQPPVLFIFPSSHLSLLSLCLLQLSLLCMCAFWELLRKVDLYPHFVCENVCAWCNAICAQMFNHLVAPTHVLFYLTCLVETLASHSFCLFYNNLFLSPSPSVLTPRVLGIALARCDFSSRDTRELSLQVGDLVKIYIKCTNGWWKGEVNGQVRKTTLIHLKS